MIHGYARVSTDSQGETGLGIQAQEQTLRSWASARGESIKITKEVSSGSGTKQPVLLDLLASLEPGDVLVVAKLDRLGRSTRRVLAIADELQERGIDLVILDLGVDSTTPAGRLVLSVMASLSEWERRTVSERTKAALAVKKARGELKRPERAVSVETAERIHQLRNVQGLTLREVVAKLNEEGRHTAQGGRWAPSSVAHIASKQLAS